MTSPDDRFREILRTQGRRQGLYDLAVSLRDEGRSKAEVYAIFDRFSEEHQDDADETVYNDILDTMDCIGGFCRREVMIFDDEP